MKTRFFILLITLIILTSAFVFPSTVSAAEAVYDVEGWVPEVGDIDGDGKVATLKDLMVLARYLDNWTGYEDMIYVKAADLNGDGLYATLADMYYLERYLAKWSGYTFGVSTDDDAEDTTTEGTTLPIYARLDFGTESKAQDLNYTTHEWLVNALTYNRDNLKVEFTEDTIIVTALRDHGRSTAIDEYGDEYLVSDRYGFALCFDDLVCYDFNNFLMPGYGSWANAPYVEPNETTRWVGQHQYMQVRMRNFTNNNIMSVAFSKQTGGYATTQIAGGLYLQGGEPATADKTGKTASIDTSWKVYTYDMNFSAHITRNLSGSYAQMVESVINTPNGCSTNNWNWFGNARNEIIGLRFSFLGGISKTNYMYYQADHYQIDTREFITKGDQVEVDYVIFGSSIEQLDEYLSYAEESSLYGYDPEYPEATTAPAQSEENINPGLEGYDGRTAVPGYEDVDFGGRTFVFAALYDDVANGGNAWEIYSDDSDAVSKAIRDRNEYVGQLYNCSISVVSCESPAELVAADIAGNQHMIDLYTQQYPESNLFTDDENYNLYNLGINFNNPWWDSAWVDTYTILNNEKQKTMYAAVGDFNLTAVQYTYVLFYNTELYNDTFSDDVIKLVRNGEWTMDVFVEKIKQVRQDTNVNDVYSYEDGDLMGWIRTGQATHAMHVASNLSIVGNENGSLRFEPSLNTEAWTAAIAAAIEAFHTSGGQSLAYSLIPSYFASDKALFVSEILDSAQSFAEAGARNVGVLPYPMVDEDQGCYANYVDNHFSVYCMPISVSDPQVVATFFELYAAHSKYLVRDEMINMYASRYFDDFAAAEMLELIFDSRTYDPGYLWWSAYESDVGNIIISGRNNVAQWITRKGVTLEEHITTFMDELNDNMN